MVDTLLVDRLTAIVRSIDYKPNWVLDVVPYPEPTIFEPDRQPDVIALHMAFYTNNADKPNDPDPVKIGRSRPFPPIVTRAFMQSPEFDSFIEGWVKQQIRDLEMHEVDEWFRVNGERWPVGDPHARGLTP